MKKNTAKKATAPITRKTDVQQSNDEHIDQDFPGFPNSPAQENVISPKTHADHVAANAEDVEIIPQHNHSMERGKSRFYCSGQVNSYGEGYSADIYDRMFE